MPPQPPITEPIPPPGWENPGSGYNMGNWRWAPAGTVIYTGFYYRVVRYNANGQPYLSPAQPIPGVTWEEGPVHGSAPPGHDPADYRDWVKLTVGWEDWGPDTPSYGGPLPWQDDFAGPAQQMSTSGGGSAGGSQASYQSNQPPPPPDSTTPVNLNPNVNWQNWQQASVGTYWKDGGDRYWWVIANNDGTKSLLSVDQYGNVIGAGTYGWQHNNWQYAPVGTRWSDNQGREWIVVMGDDGQKKLVTAGTGIPAYDDQQGAGWNWNNWQQAPIGTIWQDSQGRFWKIIEGPDGNKELSRVNEDGSAYDGGGGAGDGDPGSTGRDNWAYWTAVLPWLPKAALQVFIQAWKDGEDERLALATMRADPRYNEWFPGNRRADGSLRHTEEEYIGILYGYQDVIEEYGMNSFPFRGFFEGMIEGEVSVSEFRDRITSMWEQIILIDQEYMNAYMEFFGEGSEATRRGLLAMAMDPELNSQILNRQITIAQIAGEGRLSGYDVGERLARDLFYAGVNRLQADQLFAQAEYMLPGLGRAALRQHEGYFGLQQYVGAEVLGDAAARHQLRRTLEGEASDFTEQASLRKDDLKIAGLTPR